jgi:hypothetical protein
MTTTSYDRRMYVIPPEDSARLANCVHSFMALYGLKNIRMYNGGRIKAQTTNGYFLDLQCRQDVERDCWVANPLKWTAQLRALDSLPSLYFRP